MQLAEPSIRRPVFATVLSLLIVLIGAVSFNRLNIREYPKIDEPVVSVTTIFTGASSEVIEAQVTKVLEDSLAGIEGVDVITSSSRQERSQISVRFALSRDADSAASDVRDNVTSAVTAGDIVSLHFGHRDTIEAIDAIVDHLAARSLRPVTLSTLLGSA